jgi:hypothetical protein
MNKLAPKEPSMDEILSSIRQIIADDEPGSGGRSEAMAQQPSVSEDEDADMDTMQLSAAQIVEGDDHEDSDFQAAAQDTEPGYEVPTGAEARESLDAAEEILMAAHEPGGGENSLDDEMDGPPALVVPDDIAFEASDEEVAEPETARAQAAPDPFDSLADRIVEPATDEAVHKTFSRLNKMYLGNEGMTLENMVREMVRPMLKEWLDENLPSIVERMVEKEIERVSRGG